jgi:hypothetical protein
VVASELPLRRNAAFKSEMIVPLETRNAGPKITFRSR